MAAAVGIYKGGVHLVELKPEEITIWELPSALALSFLRMLTSYVASLVFAFVLGLLAARTKLGERIIIPTLDILQSIPVVGFFPAAISFFIGATSGHRLGIELASAFLIFTSQAWNMAFAVYEATKTIPQENFDAVASFGVSGSQRFWKLYAPACVPRLIYNSILSWSNGWYFLVACEIIAVGLIHYHLPGIGSFLSRAAEANNINLVLWGLFVLASLILLLDTMVWRPLSIWSQRFRQDYSSSGAGASRGTSFSMRSTGPMRPVRIAARKMLKALSFPLLWAFREMILPLLWDFPAAIARSLGRFIYQYYAQPALARWNRVQERIKWLNLALLWIVGVALGFWAAFSLFGWLRPPWPAMAREIPLAILMSTGRLIVALLICLAATLPIVLWSWNKPRLRQWLTTIAQVGASLPAIALFPLIILVAVRRFGGGMELASIALLLTGMFWYPLFNCLGGAAIIPGDLAEAARALGLTRFQTWRRLVLPAIQPALITGMLTAWGGGWNALVVSEYVKYKDSTLTVRGIGALLSRAVYELGDNQAITLCIASMVGWILIINSVFWRPIYRFAVDRYKFEA